MLISASLETAVAIATDCAAAGRMEPDACRVLASILLDTHDLARAEVRALFKVEAGDAPNWYFALSTALMLRRNAVLDRADVGMGVQSCLIEAAELAALAFQAREAEGRLAVLIAAGLGGAALDAGGEA